MNRKFLCGFSLAEALVTMLIVCLITLAAVPVLTKKKRQAALPGGSWVCSLDENGRHIVYSSTTKSWRNSGSKCIFTPPRDARNFEVIAVGGGGGGASGYRESKIIRLYGNSSSSQNFIAPADGEYEVTVIGGGGQGGKRQNNANRCKENPGGPGGSGGFANDILTFTRNYTYYLKAGAGGSGGGYNGGNGGESYVSRNGSKLISAAGGGGGGGRWGAACGRGTEDRQDDHWGSRGSAGSPNGVEGYFQVHPSDDNKVRTTAGAICRSSGVQSEVLTGSIAGISCETLLRDSKYLAQSSVRKIRSGNGYASFNANTIPYGHGGAGHDSNGGRENGEQGILILRYNIIYSGDGGRASTANRQPIFPDLKKLEATIGAGGIGATAQNSDGSNGGTTTYTVTTRDRSLTYTSNGGSAGRSQMATKSSASDAGHVAGGTGGESDVKPYRSNATGGLGGLVTGNASVNALRPDFKDINYYGAGGGGGGANDTSWGKGANGAPGAVMVYW